MKLNFLSLVALAVGAILAPVSAKAAITVTSAVGGSAIAGANYVSFDNSGNPLALVGDSVGSGTADFTVTFAPNGAGYVSGAASGQYAAPWASGNNNVHFGGSPGVGSPGVGVADNTTYLTTGNTGSVTLDFSGANMQYFGLLWGSVDNYNTLAFYKDGESNPFFSITPPTAGLPLPSPGGDQNLVGTSYVNVAFTGGDYFDKVVATSGGTYAFEFDNVAYSTSPTGADPVVPEPATLAIWGLGLGIAGLVRLRRKS